MKKILAIVLLSVMLVGFSPSVKAMEVQPSQQELTQQLIQVILSLIAQLQAQMNEMIAQKNASNAAVQQQSQTINQIQQNTQQIAQNTTPPPAVVSPTQVVIPDLIVSCTGEIKGNNIEWTATATGGDGNYKYGWDCGYITYPDGSYAVKPGNNWIKQCYIEPSTHTSLIADFLPNGGSLRDYDSNGDNIVNIFQAFIKSGNQEKRAMCNLPI